MSKRESAGLFVTLARLHFQNHGIDPDQEREPLIVPTPEEYDGAIYVCRFTIQQMAEYLRWVKHEYKLNPDDVRPLQAYLYIAAVVDEQGQPIYTRDDTELVSGLDEMLLSCVAMVVIEMHKLKDKALYAHVTPALDKPG